MSQACWIMRWNRGDETHPEQYPAVTASSPRSTAAFRNERQMAAVDSNSFIAGPHDGSRAGNIEMFQIPPNP